jgi:deoxycytidylate deaminase
MGKKFTDVDFIRAAYLYGGAHSDDKSTQNGAILVRDGGIIAYGANRFPPGVEVSDERLERLLKYSFMEHAERDVILDAVNRGISTKGTTMYVPWFACADCGRAIIRAGVSKVIGHTGPEKWYLEDKRGKNHTDWNESIKLALQMFDEAGVEYGWIDDKIGGVELIFGEKTRKP